jgi:5'-nucleotidase (lipoprotein e(P4) family)
MRLYLYAAAFLVIVSACSTPNRTHNTHPNAGWVNGGKIWSSIFQQQAAEYDALCIQAYNIARFRLDDALLLTHSKPLAIVTDIDETVLDNSPYAVRQGLAGKDYELSTWHQWTSLGAADTMTAALAFFKYAASKNVTVFYITNRDEKERNGTLLNLQKFNFPDADNDHLLLKSTTSGKEARRQQVSSTHEIVLLLGDNLSDFSSLFDKRTTNERAQNVQALSNEFGKRFILLPNFNYGGWEEALFNLRYDWTPKQKDSIIRSQLKSY